MLPNSTLSREGHSQEGSNLPSTNLGNNRSQAGNNLVSSKAGRQPPSLRQDGFPGSQHGPLYSTPSRGGSANSTISQEGSHPPSCNSGNTRSQAGYSSASSQAVRCSARLRASQADSIIPQVDSEVSLVNGVSSQAVRCLTRLRASQASQTDSTISQVDIEVSQASGASPP